MGAGLESFIFREVDALMMKGRDIVLFATKYRENDVYSPRPEWEHYRLRILPLLFSVPGLCLTLARNAALVSHATTFKGLGDLLLAAYYSRIMKKIGVTQVHCHFGDHKLFVGYYCKRLLGLPLSVTIHSHELHANPNEALFKQALPACDAVFAISHLAVEILTRRYQVPADRVSLSRLFLDMALWRPKAPFRVLTVGRFEPQKGHWYLLQAISMLADLEIEFIVVGWGPVDIRQLAIDCGVDKHVVVFDKLDQRQLRLMYQSCDMFCLPSIAHTAQGMEGIPAVLIEAMACGLPVVATRPGGVPEIVDEILVDERDSAQLAAAIRLIHDNAELRRRLGERNRTYVSQHYSVRNIDTLNRALTAVNADRPWAQRRTGRDHP